MPIHNPTGGSSNVIDGFSINSPTNSQLSTYTFNDCTLNMMSNSGHPATLTGTSTIRGSDGHFKGTSTQITVDAVGVNGGDSITTSATQDAGSMAALVLFQASTSAGSSSVSVTTSQTSGLNWSASLSSESDSNDTSLTLVADSITSSITCLSISAGGVQGGTVEFSFSASAASSVDISPFSGGGILFAAFNTCTITLPTISAANVILAGSMNVNSACNDTWAGSWTDDGITNAILASYVSGGSNGGALTVQGASPSGQGIVDAATLVGSGVNLTTN